MRIPFAALSKRDDDPGSYLDRLLKLIPTEVIAVYLVGIGILNQSNAPNGAYVGWAIFCLICVVVVRTIGTKPPNGRMDVVAVVIACISFVIWVYSMSDGPFSKYDHFYQAWLSSLLILGWTFLVPYVYRGPDAPHPASNK